jgi:hypothetical protein
LHNGKILNESAYQEYIKPAELNDGTQTKYAKGITITDRNGKKIYEHGGGIFGFLSQNSYYPDEDISIVVLTNTTGPVSPEATERKIAEFLFNTTADEDKKFDGDLSRFVGTYKGRGRGEDLAVQVTENDTTILVQRRGPKPAKLRFVGDNAWTDGNVTFYFTGKANTFDELRVDEIYNFYILKKENK